MSIHINTFDHYAERESPIHRLDPRVKVVITLLFIVSNVLLPDGTWIGYLLAWLITMGLGAIARLHPWFLIKRSFIVLPFTLAAVTVLRSWISLQFAIWLTATTRFPDLLHALRHLRVPGILVSIIAFMYRYLFVLADEASRLLRARAARSARPAHGQGGGSIVWRARIAGHMVGQLFIRSFERSDRVYNAMLARGYRGELLTMTPHVMHRSDWLGALLLLLPIIIIQLVGRLF